MWVFRKHTNIGTSTSSRNPQNSNFPLFYKFNEIFTKQNSFLDTIDRLAQKDYLPTDQDILHSSDKTLGIYEIRFLNDNRPFKITDVGKQNSQRGKWILCFEGVNAMIFWVNLNGFDTYCEEDPNTLALIKSLQIFEATTLDTKKNLILLISNFDFIFNE